jgi:hypothetical protein
MTAPVSGGIRIGRKQGHNSHSQLVARCDAETNSFVVSEIERGTENEFLAEGKMNMQAELNKLNQKSSQTIDRFHLFWIDKVRSWRAPSTAFSEVPENSIAAMFPICWSISISVMFLGNA